IAADQPGNGLYNAAPTVFQSFVVTKAAQSIDFPVPPNVPLGPPATVAATATSGLAVTFSTTTPSVCTAGGTDGATITLLTAGTCTVRAAQAGNAPYDPAPPVLRSFGVGKTDQTITFAALPDLVVTHAPVVVTATASSGLFVTFSSVTPTTCSSGGPDGG